MQIVLFHSALGLRAVERETAALLRGDGHDVVVPDLYDGVSAATLEDGLALMDAVGWPRICATARRALEGLPGDAVLAGISMGAGVVSELWRDRPRTPAVLLIHGCAALPDRVRTGARAALHVAGGDPFAPEDVVDDWEAAAAAAGMEAVVHRYPGAGHFFSDPASPEFDDEATARLRERVRSFLRRVEGDPLEPGDPGRAAE